MGATSEMFIQMQDAFFNDVKNYENGNTELLDIVIQFRKEREFYEQMIENIKSFEDEHFSKIEEKAKEYQNEYKGCKFEFRSGRRTFNFKGIKEIDTAESNLKELKSKYQSAFDGFQKGLQPVDENGELLKLPEVNYSKSVLVLKLPK